MCGEVWESCSSVSNTSRITDQLALTKSGGLETSSEVRSTLRTLGQKSEEQAAAQLPFQKQLAGFRSPSAMAVNCFDHTIQGAWILEKI